MDLETWREICRAGLKGPGQLAREIKACPKCGGYLKTMTVNKVTQDYCERCGPRIDWRAKA